MCESHTRCVRLGMSDKDAVSCAVMIVVKNLQEYLLRVHSQTCRRFSKLKDVKCESVKMQKQQH